LGESIAAILVTGFREHEYGQMGFFDWFKRKSGKGRRPATRSVRATGAFKTPQKSAPGPQSADAFSYTGNIEGRITDGGPGKNVLIRNKYVREDTGTHETLKIIDDSILEDEDEFGADPYNTGRFDRSGSWNSARSRK
jgi:hypothetical protein